MSTVRAFGGILSGGGSFGWLASLQSLAARLTFGARRLHLGQIAGIEVTVTYTWPIFALVTFALTFGYLPESMPSFTPLDFALVGCLSVLLLFGSVLFHELCHSLVAQARGLEVRRITLFVLGGMTEIEGDIADPVDEILVYLVGPLSSLALAGSFFGLGRLPNAGGPVLAVMPYLATINLVLAVVNFVPGLPLDGGRVLRAAVWKATGSARSATYWASVLGQGFAVVLVLLAVAQLATGGFLGAAWNLFIAWVLNGAAGSSRQVPATDVVRAPAAEIPPTALRLADAPMPVRVDEGPRIASSVADCVLGAPGHGAAGTVR